jgi:hypothetical protein
VRYDKIAGAENNSTFKAESGLMVSFKPVYAAEHY